MYASISGLHWRDKCESPAVPAGDGSLPWQLQEECGHAVTFRRTDRNRRTDRDRCADGNSRADCNRNAKALGGRLTVRFLSG